MAAHPGMGRLQLILMWYPDAHMLPPTGGSMLVAACEQENNTSPSATSPKTYEPSQIRALLGTLRSSSGDVEAFGATVALASLVAHPFAIPHLVEHVTPKPFTANPES